MKRDHNNRRIFDEHDVNWIHASSCLKRCGFSIKEMKVYLQLCLEGPKSIQERKDMLMGKEEELHHQIKELQDSIDYIHWKQNLYDEFLNGQRPYTSNLIKSDE